MSKVLISGGGAAGMIAAVSAARAGHQVHLYEKNEKLGKKLFITGKGRCNLTNACELEGLFSSVMSNPRFLYSAFYGFSNQQTIEFFEELGLRMKIERGNRVFPASDHSSDVIHVLTEELCRLRVRVYLHTEVQKILSSEGRFSGFQLKDGEKVSGDAGIVATGGLSYPSTGSTGDGYRFARGAGHSVTEMMPSLVPMEVEEDYIQRLQGLSLRNVEVSVYDGKKKLYEDFGEMLFTHYGVSGPVILSASSMVGKTLQKHPLKLVIDLKPALSLEQLDSRVRKDFEENKNKLFKNAVDKLFPAMLRPVMVDLSGILPEKKVNEISREERLFFVHRIKHLELTLTRLRGYNEAVITKGGVCVREIDPGTMESKKLPGLYFAGEVMDLDALTGGFNLQIAWSTGYAAGKGIR